MQTELRPGQTQAIAPVRLSKAQWGVVFLAIGWLWFHLIDNLRLEWTTDPQYSYSLVVPILVAGLLLRRFQRFSKAPSVAAPLTSSVPLAAVMVLLAFLYLPTRLIEEATPEWRPIGWLLAVETIGFTLYALYLFLGWAGLKRYAFPICFFFTAVPWPTLFEQPVIQSLSRANAVVVVEILGMLGVPAMQHGNIIEISTCLVGINDACSGIRSFQSSLMISLFLGEFYFFNWRRRVSLLLAGFGLAMAFNVCRTSVLTYIAAKHGTEAIAQYHDETGMAILLACTATLWAVGYLLSLRQKPAPAAVAATDSSPLDSSSGVRLKALFGLACKLAIWMLIVEVGIAAWYTYREAGIKPGPKWTVVLPEHNATFRSWPFTPEEHQLLRFDNGKQGQWQEDNGTLWQAFYFDWAPGRVAGYLAKRHTPDICLPAVGMTMLSGPTLTMLKVNNLELPVREYVFSGPTGAFQVFQCHWEPGVEGDAYAQESSRLNLIRGIWAGRGNKGQKVIEIVVHGYDSLDSARAAVAQELEKLIQVEKS